MELSSYERGHQSTRATLDRSRRERRRSSDRKMDKSDRRVMGRDISQPGQNSVGRGGMGGDVSQSVQQLDQSGKDKVNDQYGRDISQPA